MNEGKANLKASSVLVLSILFLALAGLAGALSVNLSVGHSQIDAGHAETIIANVSGGVPSSYALNIVNASGSLIYSNSINTTNSSMTFSWNAVVIGQLYANVSVQSNSVANQIVSQNVSFNVEPGLTLTNVSLKSNNITEGQEQDITTNIEYGSAPFVYSYTIYNSSGSVVANTIHQSNLTSYTFSFNQSSSFGVGNFIANVIVTNSSNEIASAVVNYVVVGLTHNAIVNLNDNPSTATITTNGNTYSNGQTMQVIGTNTITANPPATGNWVFSSWDVSNSINLTVANAIDSSTTLTAIGNGTVTAKWDGISKFVETGLPSGTTWNVIYDRILNSSSTGAIPFLTPPGNFSFMVANQVSNGVIYIPSRSTGYLNAGNVVAISFVPTYPPVTTPIITSTNISTPAEDLLKNLSSLLKKGNSRAISKKRVFNINSIVEALETSNNIINTKSLPNDINGIFNGVQSVYTENALIAYTNNSNSIGGAKYTDINLYSYLSNDKIVSYSSAIPPRVKAPILANPNPLLHNIFVESKNEENAITTNVIISTYPSIENFSRLAYAEFRISSSLNDANVISADYNFSVSKAWINSTGISPDQVTLYKYVNTAWIPLPTYTTGSNATSYDFSAVSNSLSTYLVSYSQNGGHSNSASQLAVNVALPPGYKLYLCSAGASVYINSTPAPSWTPDVNAPPGKAFSSLVVNASIGHQTSNTCSATMANEAYYGMALAGIGVNAISYNLYKNSINNAGSLSLSYNVLTSNSLTVILGAMGWYGGGSITPPSGCTSYLYSGNYSNAYASVCQNQAKGAYTVTASDSNTSTSFALAAYVFPPGNVILDDNPSTATITTNGNTYGSGQAMQVIGTNAITANPPLTGNWVFNSWSLSNLNLTLSSATTNPSTLTVMGNGIVTAKWNGISKFVETGLPSATTWNVIYDGILNASTTNTISFSTVPGNYLFTVANQVVGSTIYVPSPSSGYLIAGNTTAITFSAVTNTCTISINPSAINFGTLSAGSSIPTTNAITDTNTGNTNAYMLVYGGNWIGTKSFGVSNTTWSASSGAPFASANRLSTLATNTLILVPASSSNSIYFGLGIPGGAPSGPYTQNIIIENSC